MTAPQQPPTLPTIHVPNPELLAQQSRPVADQLYQAVGNQYLAFRRDFFHDANASLATEPPAHPQPHQTETAKLAERALQVVPGGAHTLPIIGDLITHLQRVVDIHSLTENELLMLHNTSMIFLYGTRDGLQAWYVEYLLDAAHKLNNITDLEYF